MKIHELKTDSVVFKESFCNKKLFEIRKDDRNFEVGDFLILKETKYSGEEMRQGKPLIYTGFELHMVITYKLPKGTYGLIDDWTVLSVALTDEI